MTDVRLEHIEGTVTNKDLINSVGELEAFPGRLCYYPHDSDAWLTFTNHTTTETDDTVTVTTTSGNKFTFRKVRQ